MDKLEKMICRRIESVKGSTPVIDHHVIASFVADPDEVDLFLKNLWGYFGTDGALTIEITMIHSKYIISIDVDTSENHINTIIENNQWDDEDWEDWYADGMQME